VTARRRRARGRSATASASPAPDTAAVAVWLGAGPPVRSIRWLDGTIEVGAALAAAEGGGTAIAIAAGDPGWLDLAADRAARAGQRCIGVATDLRLDYLGWAQVAAAAARQLAAATVLVDEASRPERGAEVAALAELLEAAQLTGVLAVAHAGDHLRVTRGDPEAAEVLRVRGAAVLGVRIAGPQIDDYPTPAPAAAMHRLDLAAIGLDPQVLRHRAHPRAVTSEPRRSVDQVAELLAPHLAAGPRALAPQVR
jgi:electron transfer flavoprotein alpha/beta subunit